MKAPVCPRCQHQNATKSGIVNDRQRWRCKACGYHYTVQKEGKKIDAYYVIKALQLYIEGISLREIERILGVSHVSVLNWVRKYQIHAPEQADYRPTYQIMSQQELITYMQEKNPLKGAGMLITELGDKFMVIRWERFRQ